MTTTCVVWLMAASAFWQTASLSSTHSTEPPACEHPGPAASGDLMPAVPKAFDDLKPARDAPLREPAGPPRFVTIRMSYRVDEQGRVSSVCVGRGLHPLFDAEVRQAIARQEFVPASQHGQAVAVVMRRELELPEPQPVPGWSTWRAIEASTDVSWLERAALAPAGLAVEDKPSDARPSGEPDAGFSAGSGGLAGHLKDRRTTAYARLGQLATDESLAAIRRIDAEIPRRSDPTPATVPATTWIHPAWHFGDARVVPLAQTDSDDGRTFAVVAGSLMGGEDLFLISSRTPDDRASWTRPLLLGARWYPGLTDARLDWRAPDTLDFRYELKKPPPRPIMDGIPERAPAPILGGVVANLAGTELDSDGDGWTDIEEERLGLDARRADTDGDGFPDGQDSCPNHAAPASAATSDAQRIVRRALFAVFSVGGSRSALLVERGIEPVHVDGYAGPILFNVDRNRWVERHGHGGVFLTWKIIRQDPDAALVEIVDWEGSLAAGGQRVYLRKIDGAWFAVFRATTWVS